MKNYLSKNLVIILLGALVPEFITFVYNKNYYNDFLFTLQYITGLVIFVSSVYLLSFNWKIFRKSEKKIDKILATIFFLLGLAFLLYISFSLFLQYSFRHGVGF